ncbi:MAG TPA: alkaline phosphatase family protein [Gammaproteobacteria bacterium]|jgi:phospholipase C|nr:alkaline phosphatase family protein [Gammaproteobacteria bacterium]
MLRNSFIEEQKIEDQISHVIVLMQENQSFDRILGDVTSVKPECEGIDKNKLLYNVDLQGNKIYQQLTTDKQMEFDPFHEVANVRKQLSQNNGGFVQDFITQYPKSTLKDRQSIMGYYPYGFLPAIHALAKEYTICDHWFASVPGPTWTNRFFALSGTSMGRVEMPDASKDPDLKEIFYQRQDSIFDRLNEKKISWRTYCGDFPISLVLAQNRRPDNLIHYRRMKEFYKDVSGPEEKFPAFTFIEPKYMGRNQNDDHPPHNTMKSQKLIGDVYNAIRANESLWKKTLFIVTYDEHGGFYDHVIPPAAVSPDGLNKEGFDFTQLGLRVPAILISPWVRKSVEKTVFDHTSILRYLSDKWDLGSLGDRTKFANSIGVALDFSKGARENCLPFIEISEDKLISEKPHLEKHAANGNQEAIHRFVELLNKEHPVFSMNFPVLSRIADCKDRIGEKLEAYGYIRLGMWCRKDADEYREKRIARTRTFIKNFLENPREMENEKEEKSKKTAITHSL